MAEMSDDDYRSQAAPPDAPTRQRLEAELEAARQSEAATAAQEVAARQAEQARRAALLAMRPPGERLLDERCSSCHTLGVLQGLKQGPLGWRWTVERMRWWHGARLQAGEASTITQHLLRTQPAGRGRVALESAAALGAALLLPACGVLWHLSVRRRRRVVS